MNWGKVVLGGVLGGVVMTVANVVLHGVVLAQTYTGLPEVFNQEGGGEAVMSLVSVALALIAAFVFAKTRGAWADGVLGGVTFGALVGALPGLTNFYWPLVFEGFPSYLAWCWLGVDVIAYALGGVVLGLLIKKA